MNDLKAFQRAAVDRIVQRLTDTEGSKRFLLADEVGLGKTIVASGVIERLQADKKGSFVVSYVCSNQEIATQNRTKLVPYSDAPSDNTSHRSARRLTLLSLDQFKKTKSDCKFTLFCFTPGTSLNLRSTTGLKVERRLLLYLLDRMKITPSGKRGAWAAFFRCGCAVGPTPREDAWLRSVQRNSLVKDFREAKIPDDFVAAVRAIWFASDAAWQEALSAAVADEQGAGVRSPSAVIGELRRGLAMATLEHLAPDLVILDEFQRFSELLDQADSPDTIVGKLMGAGTKTKDIPVLILSATPYRFEGGHSLERDSQVVQYRKFLDTLRFLFKCDRDALVMAELTKCFHDFARQIRSPNAWGEAVCAELIETRDKIQRLLTDVVTRTERNWYLEGVDQGVQEFGVGARPERLPNEDELKDFQRLRTFLISQKIDDWKIMDFWKSAPRPLLFMDQKYALIKKISGKQRGSIVRRKVPIPSGVLPDNLTGLAKQNLRFRLLLPRVFGETARRRKRHCRFLWLPPTHFYYEDRFFQEDQPAKFLLFSHWRMVPKAVSILVSQEANDRLPGKSAPKKSRPLTFRGRSKSFLIALWAAPGLASIVDPLRLVAGAEPGIPVAQLHRLAVKHLCKYIADHPECGLTIGEQTRVGRNLIPAMLRLDAKSGYLEELRLYLSQLRQNSKCDKDLRLRVDEIEALLAVTTDIRLTEDEVSELAHIALFSPAICTLRASWTKMDSRAESVVPALRFGVDSLRRFFHSPEARQIVREHRQSAGAVCQAGRHNYARDVVAYCRDGQFQAVIDEFVWLLHGTAQRRTAEGERGLFAHLGRAMGMWAGKPKINKRVNGHLRPDASPRTTRYAIAFGDEVSREGVEDGRGAQRSAVRDAFNSPFWPFVLATTSVGQEGLDFHLYCRDIVHWNLPTNPVDLEQREGRINRFDGLFVRQNIARDFEFQTCLQHHEKDNFWDGVFRCVDATPSGLQRFKHGLYPHWIYESESDRKVSRLGEPAPLIRRHLLFHTLSEDEEKYAQLKRELSTYRLAFGQPRQKDLLEDVLADNQGLERKVLESRSRRYMVNLSPMDSAHVEKWVDHHTETILAEDRVVAFIGELRQNVLTVHEDALAVVRDDIDILIRTVEEPGTTSQRRRDALWALVYLANPYDDTFDFLDGIGFTDDIKIIQETVTKLGPKIP